MVKQGWVFLFLTTTFVLGVAIPLRAETSQEDDICGVWRSVGQTNGFDEPNIPFEVKLDWGEQGPYIVVCDCGSIIPAKADVIG